MTCSEQLNELATNTMWIGEEFLLNLLSNKLFTTLPAFLFVNPKQMNACLSALHAGEEEEEISPLSVYHLLVFIYARRLFSFKIFLRISDSHL
jgi:hypothetical protein